MSNHNERALADVRKKISEVLNKEDSRLVFGYRSEVEPERKEGDVWEDYDGRKWTIKNGIRQNVTKLDGAKTPWWCPKCSGVMNHRFDVKFWRMRGHCYTCHIQEETKLRAEGRWEEVENRRTRLNVISELRDTIDELQHQYENLSAPEIVHADETRILMIEKWDVDLETVKKDMLEEITRLKSLLAGAEKEHEEIEQSIKLAYDTESNG